MFTPTAGAVFLSRPNRFVIRARIPDTGEEVTAHCPNPGRMRELLLPGRKVILERSDSPGRKTPWTLAAVEYRGNVMPLISSRANGAAGSLVIPSLFPQYAAQPEQLLGSSRIDWKLTGEGHCLWVEVKSCTLVEKSRAMFPDAPSERAVKHLKELSGVGSRGVVIFAVMNHSAEVFSANPHTDPSFSIAMNEASEQGVRFHAVSLRCAASGEIDTVNIGLPVDFRPADMAKKDEGVVLKLWTLPGGQSGLTLERGSRNLSRLARSRRLLPGIGTGSVIEGVLPIRGNPAVFTDFDDELSGMFEKSGNGIWKGNNIMGDVGFLNLLLDYRHRRVFQR